MKNVKPMGISNIFVPAINCIDGRVHNVVYT